MTFVGEIVGAAKAGQYEQCAEQLAEARQCRCFRTLCHGLSKMRLEEGGDVAKDFDNIGGRSIVGPALRGVGDLLEYAALRVVSVGDGEDADGMALRVGVNLLQQIDEGCLALVVVAVGEDDDGPDVVCGPLLEV